MPAWVVIYRRHLRQSGKPSTIRLLRSETFISFTSSTSLNPLSSIFRIFFQVPYPATPLFAALVRLLDPERFYGTKTAGVCTQNSHSGSPRLRPRGTRHSPPVTRHCIQVLSSHTLAHSFALFCTLQKLNPFLFKRFRTLRQKTREGLFVD